MGSLGDDIIYDDWDITEVKCPICKNSAIILGIYYYPDTRVIHRFKINCSHHGIVTLTKHGAE